MGVHAKQKPAAADTSAIVVGGGRRRFKLNPRKRLVLLIGGCIVLLVVVLGAVYLIYKPANTKVEKGSKTVLTPQQKTDQAVSKTTLKPDYDTANSVLDKQLKAAKTDKDKAQVYLQMASIDVQQKKTQDALNDLLQASKLDPSLADGLARNIADEYKAVGNKTEAIKYYQKAIAYYQSPNYKGTGVEYYVKQMQKNIQELQK